MDFAGRDGETGVLQGIDSVVALVHLLDTEKFGHSVY